MYFDRVAEDDLEPIIEGIRRGDVPEAARGGVPGDLRAVSKTLAGLGTLRETTAHG